MGLWKSLDGAPQLSKPAHRWSPSEDQTHFPLPFQIFSIFNHLAYRSPGLKATPPFFRSFSIYFYQRLCMQSGHHITISSNDERTPFPFPFPFNSAPAIRSMSPLFSSAPESTDSTEGLRRAHSLQSRFVWIRFCFFFHRFFGFLPTSVALRFGLHVPFTFATAVDSWMRFQ